MKNKRINILTILFLATNCMKAERIDLDPGSPVGAVISIVTSELSNSTPTAPSSCLSAQWDDAGCTWDNAVWEP